MTSSVRPHRRLQAMAMAVTASVILAACSGAAINEDDTEPASDPDSSAPATTGDGALATTGDGATATTGAGATAGEPVTVALLNPVTGPYAALGEDVNAGFELYVENHDGQLAGHPIEILKEDTANDTAVAQEAVVKVVEEGADMMLGFVSSGVTYGVAPTIRDSGVPLMITTAGADDLTQRDDADNIFRLSYTSSQDAMPLGEYACNELGYETAVIVGLDYAFGWEAAGGFAKVFEDAGCEIVQEIYAPLGTADWAPFVQQIDTTADAVWAVIPGSDGIRFVQAYNDFGVELPLLGHGSTTDEQILDEQGADAEGAITSLHYSGVVDTPANQEFKEAFESATDRSVSQYSEHGWATAQVLEAALESIEGEVTPEALTAAIGSVEVEAPRGPLSFDDYGQAVYNVYVREVAQVDGEWVNKVIHTYPDVSQFWTYDPEEFMSGPPLGELHGTWAS